METKDISLKGLIKVSGLENAVNEYQIANAGGVLSPRYGYLMLDLADGQVWTDEFFSLGHNDWKKYHSDSIIYLSIEMHKRRIPVNNKTVREFLKENYPQLSI